MPISPPYFLLESPHHLVPVQFDGAQLMLPEGMNLAAALLAADVTTFRKTPLSGSPRAPFCMMGACFDCLVEIDGVTRQACMQQVTADVVITRAGRRPADG